MGRYRGQLRRQATGGADQLVRIGEVADEPVGSKEPGRIGGDLQRHPRPGRGQSADGGRQDGREMIGSGAHVQLPGERGRALGVRAPGPPVAMVGGRHPVPAVAERRRGPAGQSPAADHRGRIREAKGPATGQRQAVEQIEPHRQSTPVDQAERRAVADGRAGELLQGVRPGLVGLRFRAGQEPPGRPGQPRLPRPDQDGHRDQAATSVRSLARSASCSAASSVGPSSGSPGVAALVHQP